MRCSWTSLLLGIALTLSARIVQAQDCAGAAIGPDAKTTATVGPPTTDGPNGGHPALSSASNGLANPGFDVSASGGLAVDDGYFHSDTRAGGDVYITCCAGSSAIVRNDGHVSDCLVMGGYADGGGFLHVPVHVTGSSLAEWSISSEYQASPGAKFAGNQVGVGCRIHVGQQLMSCTGGNLEFDVDQSVDARVELVFAFTFGAPTQLEILPTADSSIGYAANGSTGTMLTTANLSVLGVLEPAYAVDGVGTPLPNTTITAASGFDYLHPVPEPGGLAASCAAAAALAARRARIRPSR